MKFLSVLLFFAATLLQGCSMEDINGAEQFELIYIDQGEEEGELEYQYGETGLDVVPNRLLVDRQGQFLFLERNSNRIQCMSPEGEFVFAVELSAQSLSSSESEQSSEQLSFIDMFWNPDGTLGILTQIFDSEGAEGKTTVVNVDANGLYLSHFELQGSPVGLNLIERVYRDELGYVWVLQETWYIFDPYGNFDSSIEEFGNCVDSRGYMYGDAEPIKVSDRNGKLVATLSAEEAPIPSLVTFVDRHGLMVSWTRGLPESTTPTTLSNPNEIILFKLNRDDWSIEPVARIEVPPNEYVYPHEESDMANPQAVYLSNTSVVAGGFLYILAYSSDSYWINKLDVSKFTK